MMSDDTFEALLEAPLLLYVDNPEMIYYPFKSAPKRKKSHLKSCSAKTLSVSPTIIVSSCELLDDVSEGESRICIQLQGFAKAL